ncbi:MAG: hypothetical protein WBA25_16610 [Jannaschia sp.]
MAERHRSKDGTRETDAFIEDMPETPSHQGRSGGELARDIGTEAALARATQQGAKGVTRVTKAKEREHDEGEEAQ